MKNKILTAALMVSLSFSANAFFGEETLSFKTDHSGDIESLLEVQNVDRTIYYLSKDDYKKYSELEYKLRVWKKDLYIYKNFDSIEQFPKKEDFPKWAEYKDMFNSNKKEAISLQVSINDYLYYLSKENMDYQLTKVYNDEKYKYNKSIKEIESERQSIQDEYNVFLKEADPIRAEALKIEKLFLISKNKTDLVNSNVYSYIESSFTDKGYNFKKLRIKHIEKPKYTKSLCKGEGFITNDSARKIVYNTQINPEYCITTNFFGKLDVQNSNELMADEEFVKILDKQIKVISEEYILNGTWTNKSDRKYVGYSKQIKSLDKKTKPEIKALSKKLNFKEKSSVNKIKKYNNKIAKISAKRDESLLYMNNNKNDLMIKIANRTDKTGVGIKFGISARAEYKNIMDNDSETFKSTNDAFIDLKVKSDKPVAIVFDRSETRTRVLVVNTEFALAVKDYITDADDKISIRALKRASDKIYTTTFYQHKKFLQRPEDNMSNNEYFMTSKLPQFIKASFSLIPWAEQIERNDNISPKLDKEFNIVRKK